MSEAADWDGPERYVVDMVLDRYPGVWGLFDKQAHDPDMPMATSTDKATVERLAAQFNTAGV